MPPPPPIPRARRRRGFTLIEAALVSVIVGIGVVSTLQLIAVGTMANIDATHLTTATHLADNVAELMTGVRFREPGSGSTWGPDAGELTVAAYDDVDDFDGAVFQPPLDVRRVPLDSHANWSQSVHVDSLDEDVITATQGKDNVNRPLARVVVRVKHHATLVYETSWLAANTAPAQ